MTCTMILLRVNGSPRPHPFLVWADDQDAATLCVRLHMEAATGLRPVEHGRRTLNP